MNKIHLDIFSPAQRILLPHLKVVPRDFALYDETAIALRLGHRISVDFDFFTRNPLDHDALLSALDELQTIRVLQAEANTLVLLCSMDEPVQLSFFGLPNLPQLYPPHQFEELPFALGDLREIAAMKQLAVQRRAEAKDYVDIHALMAFGISLAEQLRQVHLLYGNKFSQEASLKALCYFEDGNLATLPSNVQRDLVMAVKALG